MAAELQPSDISYVPSTTNDNGDAETTASANITGSAVHYISKDETTPNAAAAPKEREQAAYQQSIEYWRDRQKPVKERNLKIYRLIAILAIIAFFPLGIPAFYHAMKLKEDYYEGIEKGDLTQCNKRSLLLNKLLILSFTLCLFSAILILALVGGIEGGRVSYQGGIHL